jgi:hypothetical protein
VKFEILNKMPYIYDADATVCEREERAGERERARDHWQLLPKLRDRERESVAKLTEKYFCPSFNKVFNQYIEVPF